MIISRGASLLPLLVILFAKDIDYSNLMTWEVILRHSVLKYA